VSDDQNDEDEKLHNSSDKSDADDDQPEEQTEESTYVVDVGDLTPTYYRRDEEGELRSYEFLPEELIYPEGFFSEEELLKAKKMKRIEADLDIINVVRTPEEANKGVTIPAPQPGEAGDLRVHLSTQIGHSSYTTVAKRARQPLLDNDDMARSGDHRPSHSMSADLGPSEDAEAPLMLGFTHSELDQYVTHRSEGLAYKSQDWIKRASQALWETTKGDISHRSVTELRTFALEKYQSVDSHSKVLSFAKSFLKFLATTRAEPSYLTFTPYLELPKTVKERKSVTSRIVTKEDINNVLQHIAKANRGAEIGPERSAQYSALVLFGAYTGQRSEATIAQLTVGQFRTALAHDKPVLEVGSPQDKIRMSHYVPLHPRVVKVLEPLLAGRNEDDLMFTHSSFKQWIKRQKIPMSRFEKPLYSATCVSLLSNTVTLLSGTSQIRII
jgi:integrase